MTEEKDKQQRKWFKKKRFFLGIPAILFIIGAVIWQESKISRLIDECNNDSKKACDELVEDYSSYVDDPEERSRITNPYLIDEVWKLGAEKRKVDSLILKMKMCKELLVKNLKDPSSFKQENTLKDQFETGIIKYSATNSFGAKIQSSFDCNN